tara:strand:- start:231 stop:836 length:606 start_codon:yes stop_codon:yes gene_type:complete
MCTDFAMAAIGTYNNPITLSSSDSDTVEQTTDIDAVYSDFVVHVSDTSDQAGDSTGTVRRRGASPSHSRSRSRSPVARLPLRRQLAFGMLYPSLAVARARRANGFTGSYASGNNADLLLHSGDYYSGDEAGDEAGDEGDEGDEAEGDDAASVTSFDDIDADSTYSYGDGISLSSSIARDDEGDDDGDDSSSVSSAATVPTM